MPLTFCSFLWKIHKPLQSSERVGESYIYNSQSHVDIGKKQQQQKKKYMANLNRTCLFEYFVNILRAVT